MPMNLQGKTALVTGGASGIGRATALAFAYEGANVVIADVIEREGEKTAEMIRVSGGDALFIRTDVSRAAEVEAFVENAVKRFGGIDCACNNAGIEGVQAATAECTVENWDRVIAINLTGVWLCMKYEIPRMLERGRGSIVNMSSVAGLVGFRNIPAYVASKHGILGLTRTAALEYADRGIRVNAVCPGIIRTAMVDRSTGGNLDVERQYIALEPVGRMGTPEEIADAVLWLSSDASSFVTGTSIPADGGFVAQ